MKRHTPMNRISPKRRQQRGQYARKREEYLIVHPYDQVWIARNGLDEALVIEVSGFVRINGTLCHCPRSDQIHHRNKGRRDRLNDERWWMATSIASHDFIEHNKEQAREEGFLLPIQADADGKWGDGNQALPTPEFMEAKRREWTA